MLTFKNPYNEVNGFSCHNKLIQETLKLRADIIEDIVTNNLDSTIDIKTLLKVIDSVDVTALTTLKLESMARAEVNSSEARAIVREILLMQGNEILAQQSGIEDKTTIDPSLLPDALLLEGETQSGMDQLDVDSFLPSNE